MDSATAEKLALIINEVIELMESKKLLTNEALSIYCALYANSCVHHGVKLDNAVKRFTLVYEGSKELNAKDAVH
jgi:hypothetical protein